MRKIKVADEVIVITGKYKGHRGKVMRVLNHGERLLVEGVNMVKKHMKPNPQMQQEGGIIEREAPIHVSNVAIYNPNTSKADRVRISQLEDGKKVRVFVSNGEVIDI